MGAPAWDPSRIVRDSVRVPAPLEAKSYTPPTSYGGQRFDIESVKSEGPDKESLVTALALIPGIGGALSPAVRQAWNASEGKKPSLGAFAGEAALNYALPGGGKLLSGAIGKKMMSKGKQIITTALKPKEKYIGEFNADELLSKYGSIKGLKGIEEKMAAAKDIVSREFQRIEQIAKKKGITIDPNIAANKAKENLERGIQAGENRGIKEDLLKAIDEWVADAAAFSKGGEIPFQAAQTYKVKSLSPMAKFDVSQPKLAAGAQAAREFRREIGEAQAGKIPAMREANKQYESLKDLEPVMEDAILRASKNRGQSLQDIIAMMGAIGGGAGLGVMGGSPAVGAGLGTAVSIPYLISRLQKSPGFASALYGTGRSLTSSGGGAEMRRRAIERAAAEGLYGD